MIHRAKILNPLTQLSHISVVESLQKPFSQVELEYVLQSRSEQVPFVVLLPFQVQPYPVQESYL